ncbi:MAG: FHA domain-containing protein [Candidatus Brocadiia bacterium]
MRLIAEFKGERREHRLGQGTLVIGRDPSCDIAFADPKLSRRHLECSVEGGRIVVRDLKTKNGTFLGSQRIEEARLPPGVPLRAGDVWLRFETEAQEESLVPSPGTAQGAPPPPDLESRVPAAENYEQDDEPTPSVDEAAPAPGPAADDARVVVRDNRWYLRDAETGLEVEIVPLQKGGAAPEAAAPPGAQLPARIIRRDETIAAPRAAVRAPGPGMFSTLMGDRKRRIRILVAALAALTVLLVVGVVLSRRPKPIPLLTRAQYRKTVDHAVELFQTDPAAAAEQLQALQQQPAEGDPKLAKILQEAFAADAAGVKNLEKGYETAEAKWEEVRKSAESTDATVSLARERFDWFQSQVIDLTYLVAARDAMKQGAYLKVLENAVSLDKSGKYGKEAAELTQQATDAIMKAVNAEAGQMQWTAAATRLGELIKARPDLADSLRPKVAEYEQNEAQRISLEEARQLVQQGKFNEAGPVLEKIGTTGPYAEQAAALMKQVRQSDLVKAAQKAYDSGSGEQAVDMLTKAGLGDSPAVARMRAVMADKAKAHDALEARHFGEAKAAWEEILRLEPAQTNAYALEAKHNLDSLPEAVKAGAHRLVDKADEDFQDHKYQAARDDYQEALKLDPASKDAKDGLARMSKSALFDFNIAISMPRDTLEQVNDVLQKLQEVRDRILTEDPLYLQVDRELTEVQRIKAKMEKKPPDQKTP